MRWEVVAWAALAVVLFAAEALAPGAFMLWMGVAAAVVFLTVWAIGDVPVLVQVAPWPPSSSAMASSSAARVGLPLRV